MLSEIKKWLPGHPWREKIQYFDTLDSTNTYAKQLATEGAPEGTVILAGQQTGGRGRLGRSFSSPAGMGIYLSVILRPDCLPEELMHLTCATGVAAANAIGRPSVGIKWTNDLVLGKRKLGGILTELSVDPATGKVAWVVVGIGINCCQKPWQFSEEIRDMACSLDMDQQDVPRLIADLITALQQMRSSLLTHKSEMMAQFSQRCVTIGSEISILRGEEVRHGKAVGVDENGGLQVVYSDGSIGTVTSGEVSIRGMYGYL
jgi:BirA family biotin operon repressor/biotin-[acetyl-CoA-carboxylase] ligase